MSKKEFIVSEMVPNTLIIGVYTPYNKIKNQNLYFEEFENLVNTLDTKFQHKIFIKLREIDKANFLSKGKLEDAIKYCTENKIEIVYFSETLTPLQERNLCDLFSAEVIDRTQLILNIFKKAAHSAEGKTQIDIAELEYLKSRLAGRGLHMAQQAGFIGARGPGETQKEQLKRYYAEKIKQAQKRLHALEKSRSEQRKQRLESKIPLVSLIGYTNAGKSSILNRLTRAGVLEEDKPFATLDTTTRTLFLTDTYKILLSDTVGFISQLPHQLIEAFKSTLEELKYANLLLLVVDISDPMWKDQIMVVKDVLSELEVNKPILYVFNKIDKLELPKGLESLEAINKEIEEFNPHVLVSTLSKESIEPLLEYLKQCNFC